MYQVTEMLIYKFGDLSLEILFTHENSSNSMRGRTPYWLPLKICTCHISEFDNIGVAAL